MSASARVPDGYEAFELPGAQVVAKRTAATALREAMRAGTLHAWAARQPGAVAMQGRATAWAVTLPAGPDVVVRHSMHGGLLAPLTRDRFLRPTRAPRELEATLRLCTAGVVTPELIAYAIYPAGGPFARADVATARLAGRSFPESWAVATRDDAARSKLIAAIAVLLSALVRAEAYHPDLNVSNILILEPESAPVAAVLDVDRMEFSGAERLPGGPRNLRRLLRSMEKRGIALSAGELEMLRKTELSQ